MRRDYTFLFNFFIGQEILPGRSLHAILEGWGIQLPFRNEINLLLHLVLLQRHSCAEELDHNVE